MPRLAATAQDSFAHRCELAEREDLRLRPEHALLRVDQLDCVPSNVKPPDLALSGHAALADLDLRGARGDDTMEFAGPELRQNGCGGQIYIGTLAVTVERTAARGGQAKR